MVGRASVRLITAWLTVFSTLFCATACFAESEVIFTGLPVKRVASTPDVTVFDELSAQEAGKYVVRIVLKGSQYLWASRENKPLRRSESGAFVTFHAEDGSGFVRIIKPDFRETVWRHSRRGVAFVEHTLLNLGSITYYGSEIER